MISRRAFLPAAAAAPYVFAQRERRRPNILFLFADDMRHSTINALGAREVRTPNLDRLAGRGVAFTRAHIMGGTSGAVCMPSRAMLHTGRTLFGIEREGQAIGSGHTMLGECFQQAGYHAFGTGKWHNGTASFSRGFNDGDNIFFGGMDDHWNVPVSRYHKAGEYPAPKPHPWDGGTGTGKQINQKVFDEVKSGVHSAELFASTIIDFLKKRDRSKPFLAYSAFMSPHDPRTMPKQYLDMYPESSIRLPENFLTEHPFDNGELKVRDELLAALPRDPGETRRHIAAYYAMITHLDAQVGRVLQALEDTGAARDTIVVFTADNGLAVGQHGLFGKQNLYDHSVRVPLMMAGPGLPAKQKRSAFCYVLDLYPTLCDLAGVPKPASVEGLSIKPAIDKPSAKVREQVYTAYRHLQRAVTDDRYKLIEYNVDGKRRTQLFDLWQDPWEKSDLSQSAGHGERLGAMRKQLERWRTELGDTRPEFGGKFWAS
jgi:arylsulfatase A-like enzyme